MYTISPLRVWRVVHSTSECRPVQTLGTRPSAIDDALARCNALVTAAERRERQRLWRRCTGASASLPASLQDGGRLLFSVGGGTPGVPVPAAPASQTGGGANETAAETPARDSAFNSSASEGHAPDEALR